MRSSSLRVSGPGLRRILVGTASLPMSCRSAPMRSRASRASSQPSRSPTVPARDATRIECAPENASRAWSASARARNMPAKVQVLASIPSWHAPCSCLRLLHPAAPEPDEAADDEREGDDRAAADQAVLRDQVGGGPAEVEG